MAIDIMEPRQIAIKRQPSFTADSADIKLAFAVGILGFLFIRWVFFEFRGFGVALFTMFFCVTAMIYLVRKDIFKMKPGLFWMGAVLFVGLSYGVYDNTGLRPWSNLFLICGAAYAVTAAAGRLIGGQTGAWFFMDGVISMVRTPFRHFDLQVRAFAQFFTQKKTNHRQIISILMAFILSGLIFLLVVPLLLSADSGGFSNIIGGLLEQFDWLKEEAMFNVMNLILAIPVSLYFFGLLAGNYYWRDAEALKLENLKSNYQQLKIVPLMTSVLTLIMVIGLYIVFIASQLPYYFSAFTGKLPNGMQIYSEYARKGFFELIQIAVINLIILGLTNAFSKVTQERKSLIKWLNIAMATVTMLFIITAFSKMILYISAYGLSMNRLLPCVLMIWLAGIFVGFILLQIHAFDLFKTGVIAGVILFCALIGSNPDSLVVNYNADRYLEGTLNQFDVSMLYRARAGGISTAMRLLEVTEDSRMKSELSEYLFDQSNNLSRKAGTMQDTLENIIGRRMILAVKQAP
jgi:hypothetical protein